ncbi:MAG: molybdopterin oxidoreductase family protein [Actinomycetota bacterium]|nr:molybdopterin oxidoreductase family protein [Actinomycetota bacterium]
MELVPSSAGHSPTRAATPPVLPGAPGLPLSPATGSTCSTGSTTFGVRPGSGSPGALCKKGWTAAELLSSERRLRHPMVRESRDQPLRPASWDEALGRVAAAISASKERFGADSVGIFGGGGLTNEKAYLLGKLARVAIGTRSIDYNGRWCMSAAAGAAVRAFGVDRGLPFPLADISGAEVVLLVGSNMVETMPPVLAVMDAQREAGGQLIVVDPRATPTAQQAALHLQIVPGTDLALANGLLHLLIEDGRIDKSYVEDRTTGFADVASVVAGWWPERVERVTGVPASALRRAATMLGMAGSAMVLTARGPEQQAQGTETVMAFINLALALGQVGAPHGGFGTLTGQGNGQGGREHGQKADQLPGYRSLSDPAARRHVASVWGVPPESLPGPGPSAFEMLSELGTPAGVKCLLVAGSNPVVSAPAAAGVEQALGRLDFLAVADVVMSETAAVADVVLPVAQWAEETGTLTNLEGRLVMRQAACMPPDGVRTELHVIAELARMLGRDSGFGPDPEKVFDELAAASAGGIADYSGIDYERIRSDEGVTWPCPSPGHPGTPRLFADSFPTSDGRARFFAVDHSPAFEDVDAEFPFVLTTGRVVAHYQSGAQTRRVPALVGASPEPFVEIHPFAARRLGIVEGHPVRLTTRRSSAIAVARVTEAIRPDTVFVPFHWGGSGRANSLTDTALDPLAKMPSFKRCAVRLEPA